MPSNGLLQADNDNVYKVIPWEMKTLNRLIRWTSDSLAKKRTLTIKSSKSISSHLLGLNWSEDGIRVLDG